MRVARPPDPGFPVPADMLAAAGGPVTLVWQNEAGGLTGRVEGTPARYIKWNLHGLGESLAAEAERLRWLEGQHPAPRVLDYLVTDAAELLITEVLPGLSAVDPVNSARPDAAIRAIAHGLRLLHSLPTAGCPYDWGVSTRISAAHISAPSPPPIDRLVVCHGDPCAPNTLVGADGTFLASVDLGRLGVADRWADLAVATMSLAWNYDEFDERVFWEAYGVEPDAARIAYYRALWNAE